MSDREEEEAPRGSEDRPSTGHEDAADQESAGAGQGSAAADEADTEADTEADDADDEGREPISVRDLMPSSPSRPRRRSRPRSDAPERPEPPAEAEEEEAEPEDSRPTPVRIAMDRPPPGDSRPAEALPSRRFEVEGQEWIVRITGRTITGSRPDPGALLMQLVFCHADDPDTPLRELLTVDRPLDALYQEDLEAFLERSREAQPPAE